MSRILPWITILLLVAPCHRAGDLTTESAPRVNAAEGASSDRHTEKYQPATKSFVAEWSFEKPLWRNVNSSYPQMREEAATWSDPDSGDWWLFGGHRSIFSNKVFHGSREKALKKNRFEKNMGKHNNNRGTQSPLNTKYFSDLWHYQPSERLWTRIYPSSLMSIPAPGGPDHPLTRPILCGGGGKPSSESKDGRRGRSKSNNDSTAEVPSKVGRVDGRVMAVYAPGSKPVDTVWLLEMNDTRLWTTYVCCDEDTVTTEKSNQLQEEKKVEEPRNQDKLSVKRNFTENSVNDDGKDVSKSAVPEEGPMTFCPDFHTLTRPPITWCDKESQALFALDITSDKPIPQGQKEYHNSFESQKSMNTTTSKENQNVTNYIPKLWRFDLALTQWEHIFVRNSTQFSSSWKCGRDTAAMHWTSLGKCLIVLCPAPGGPSNLLHSSSMCMERDTPKLQSLGTIRLSQGASQARRWTISTIESPNSGRRYLLLAYGRLLDLWVLEQGSINWTPLENIWQGAALKWFRANMGLYHLKIVEDGLLKNKKGSEEEEEEEVEEVEEGKALGIGHLGKINSTTVTKQNGTRFAAHKNKIPAASKRKYGGMEVFMVNPRDGTDVSLREQGLFIIRISEDSGALFGKKAEIHNAQGNEQTNRGNDSGMTVSPDQTDEALNDSLQATTKVDDEMARNELVETVDGFDSMTTPSIIGKEGEGESENYDQGQEGEEEDDDEWSAELVLETNGSSPVLNASLLALVQGTENVEAEDKPGKENDPEKNVKKIEGIDQNNALNHISNEESIKLNQIPVGKEPLIEASAIVNLEHDQADKIGVIRPLTMEDNEMGRGSVSLGAFGSEEESGYQGTVLFFAVSFSMFMLFVVVAFIRRFVVINCQFASHHLPHRCRSNSSVLLKEPPPIRYSVIPDEVCYAGMNSTSMPAPGSPVPPASINTSLTRPLTT